MARSIAEETHSLSVFFLKKHGYLSQESSSKYGGIQWKCGTRKNNMSFWVVTSDYENESEETSYVELIYTVTDHWSEKKTDMRYKIPLVTTPCNYGGRRHWFRCPLYKNGIYCGRRVGVVYSVGNWFGCRHCAEIAYEAQFQGGNCRMGSVTEPDVERAYNEVKLEYYNGRPTRKYRRYLRLRQKMDESWIRMLGRLGDRF